MCQIKKDEYKGTDEERFLAIRADIQLAVRNAFTVNMPNTREYNLTMRIGELFE